LLAERIGRGRSDPPIGLSTPELDFSTITTVVVVVVVIITLVKALDHVIGKSSMVAGRSGRPGDFDRGQHMMLSLFL